MSSLALSPLAFAAASTLLGGMMALPAAAQVKKVAPAQPIAGISKLSPDLVSELVADPASGLTGKAGSLRFYVNSATSSLGTKAGTTTPVAKHRILVNVVKGTSSIGLSTKYLSHVGIHSVNATGKQILALLASGKIKSISVDRNVASTSFSTPLDVNSVSVGADNPTSQVVGTPMRTGHGVTVAVIDSGIAPVDDIASHIVAFDDEVNGLTAPYDDYGHGTHVAGIVAGDGTDSSTGMATKEYRGIAPGASIVGVKVIDANGCGTASRVIAGIDWCIAHQAQYGIRVINMSLTGPVLESYKTDPVCLAVEAAVKSGIVVVVSAGNLGGVYGYIGSPANDPNVITVGASNTRQTADRSDDIITSYTSRGPTMVDGNFKPDLIAPGNKIVSLRSPGSTLDKTNLYYHIDQSEYLSGATGTSNAYARLSGTSMSAPAVAGAVALMLEQNATLKPNGVKLALMRSAQPLVGYDPLHLTTVTYDPLTQGAGELNVPGAMQLASVMTPAGLTATPVSASVIGGVEVPVFASVVDTFIEATVSSDGSDVPVAVTPTQTWWSDPSIWSNPDLWSTELTWGAVTNNLQWGGGDLDFCWMGGADNLQWGGGDLDLQWMGGADNLQWGGGDLDLQWQGDANSLPFGGGGD